MLVMLALTQMMRYVLARRGVTDKQGSCILFYLIGSVFILLTYVFELRLQTYVILGEVITNSIGIGLVVLEIAVGVWVFKVLRHKKQSN